MFDQDLISRWWGYWWMGLQLQLETGAAVITMTQEITSPLLTFQPKKVKRPPYIIAVIDGGRKF